MCNGKRRRKREEYQGIVVAVQCSLFIVVDHWRNRYLSMVRGGSMKTKSNSNRGHEGELLLLNEKMFHLI